jgi:hypothetical protein
MSIVQKSIRTKAGPAQLYEMNVRRDEVCSKGFERDCSAAKGQGFFIGIRVLYLAGETGLHPNVLERMIVCNSSTSLKPARSPLE